MISFGLQLRKQFTRRWGNNMLKIVISKLIKKHGLKGLLLKIGDVAVSITKSKKDDEAWAKAKKFLEEL
jgi:hypothetical protein|tara:strand:- start:74 stop:280 length:207 start_codon:yes stop_codon:yes gene_type:complete